MGPCTLRPFDFPSIDLLYTLQCQLNHVNGTCMVATLNTGCSTYPYFHVSTYPYFNVSRVNRIANYPYFYPRKQNMHTSSSFRRQNRARYSSPQCRPSSYVLNRRLIWGVRKTGSHRHDVDTYTLVQVRTDRVMTRTLVSKPRSTRKRTNTTLRCVSSGQHPLQTPGCVRDLTISQPTSSA